MGKDVLPQFRARIGLEGVMVAGTKKFRCFHFLNLGLVTPFALVAFRVLPCVRARVSLGVASVSSWGCECALVSFFALPFP